MRKDTRHIAEIINRSMEEVPDKKKEPGQDGGMYVRLTQEELQNLVYNAKNCERARKAIRKLREEISASKANIREYDREAEKGHGDRKYRISRIDSGNRTWGKRGKHHPKRTEDPGRAARTL